MFNNCGFINALGCLPKNGIVPNSPKPYVKCKYNWKKKVQSLNPKYIITLGNALYSIVEETNIQWTSFINYKSGVPSTFFTPEFNCVVAPMPDITDLIGSSHQNTVPHLYLNFPVHFSRRQILSIGTWKTPIERKEYNPIFVENNIDTLRDLLTKDLSQVSFDIETTGLQYFKYDILSLQFCIDGKNGYFFQWENSREFKSLVNKIFAESKELGSANGLYDIKGLRYHGIHNARTTWDVNYANHFIFSGRGNSLKAAAYFFTDIGGYDNELDWYNQKYRLSDYSKLPIDVLGKYAAIDSIVTWNLMPITKSFMNEAQVKLFREIYMPLTNLFAEIEMKGMPIDLEALRSYRIICKNRMKELEEIVARTHPGININSNEDLGRLFQIEGGACFGKNKKGLYKVDEFAISKWKEAGIEIAKDISEYKELSKMVNTYLAEKVEDDFSRTIKDSVIELIVDEDDDETKLRSKGSSIIESYNPRDGRSHPSFRLQSNWVSRVSCDWAQTLPIKSNKYFRSIFKAPEGKYISEIDLAGCHLRFVAAVSGDESMKQIFSTTKDMHSKTACAVFTPEYTFEEFIEKMTNGTPEERKRLKEYRNQAKACFTGDTKIYTNQGLKRLDELVSEKNSGEFISADTTIKILTRKGYEPIQATIFKESEEVYDLELEDGSTISVTEDHLMIVLRGGLEVKVQVKDLEPNDLFIKGA
jgi:DNA polymerase I-like protein with 3'-5' exonuclease and polymerase domains